MFRPSLGEKAKQTEEELFKSRASNQVQLGEFMQPSSSQKIAFDECPDVFVRAEVVIATSDTCMVNNDSAFMIRDHYVESVLPTNHERRHNLCV